MVMMVVVVVVCVRGAGAGGGSVLWKPWNPLDPPLLSFALDSASLHLISY